MTLKFVAINSKTQRVMQAVCLSELRKQLAQVQTEDTHSLLDDITFSVSPYWFPDDDATHAWYPDLPVVRLWSPDRGCFLTSAGEYTILDNLFISPAQLSPLLRNVLMRTAIELIPVPHSGVPAMWLSTNQEEANQCKSAPTPVPAPLDAEINAIAEVLSSLGKLNSTQALRVLRYMRERYEV